MRKGYKPVGSFHAHALSPNAVPETVWQEAAIRRTNVGNRVSMSYPQASRYEVCVNGKCVRLRPMAHRFVEILLIRGPFAWIWYDELTELLWPDPDTQALTAREVLKGLIVQARDVGVPVETYYGWGCRIATEQNG